jgi:hypothetical protein
MKGQCEQALVLAHEDIIIDGLDMRDQTAFPLEHGRAYFGIEQLIGLNGRDRPKQRVRNEQHGEHAKCRPHSTFHAVPQFPSPSEARSARSYRIFWCSDPSPLVRARGIPFPVLAAAGSR